MNIPENILSTLSDEQKKKIEAARSPEEICALVNQFGTELSPDQLERVSGGLSGPHDRGETLNPDHKHESQIVV